MSETQLPLSEKPSAEYLPPQNAVVPETLPISVAEFEPKPETAPDTNPSTQPEPIPFYALNEETIRAEIAAAFDNQPPVKPKWYFINPDQEQQSVDAREEDIEKARLMAKAEHPYRVAAIAKWDESVEILDTIKPRFEKLLERSPASGLLLHTVMHPIKIAKGSRKMWNGIVLETKAWNAAQIVGTRYDKMLAAAMPFARKLDVLDVLPDKAKQSEQTGAEARRDESQTEKKFSPATETLIQQLRLDEQLQEQQAILARAGLLERLSTGEYGVRGEGSEEFAAPNPQQIRELVEKNQELVKYKASQGFTRLLIVPNAVPLEKFFDRLQDRAKAHMRAGKLFDTQGVAVNAIGIDEVYQYSHLRELTDGVHDLRELGETSLSDKLKKRGRVERKPDVAKQDIPGWRVALVKNMPELPLEPRDVVSFGGRGEFLTIPAFVRPKNYVNLLHTDPRFSGEKGFTAEMWYAHALTELERDDVLVDSLSGTLLLGSYGPHSLPLKRRGVYWIGWNLKHQSRWDDENRRLPKQTKAKLVVGGGGSEKRPMPNVGVRTAVELA